MSIQDSCLGYFCHNSGWKIGVEVCVCYDEKLIKDVEDKVFKGKYKQ